MDWFEETEKVFARDSEEGSERCRALAQHADPQGRALAAWAVACFGPEPMLQEARGWAEQAALACPNDSEIAHTLLWVYASQEDWPATALAWHQYLTLHGSISLPTPDTLDDLAHLVQKAHTAGQLESLQSHLPLSSPGWEDAFSAIMSLIAHLSGIAIDSDDRYALQIKTWKEQYQTMYSNKI